jgi:hypothetical protein
MHKLQKYICNNASSLTVAFVLACRAFVVNEEESPYVGRITSRHRIIVIA